MNNIDELRAEYRELINDILPREIQQPVRFNHCFARIVLDWLFQDVWYEHIEKRPAYKTLTSEQLTRVIERMNEWRTNRELLIVDNQASLQYRGKT